MIVDFTKLSKIISHALRHEPGAYGLELDNEGWVSVGSLLLALRTKDPEWQELTSEHLHEVLLRSEKRRHEIQGERIRALYGHSTPDRLSREAKRPPELLYHGTDPVAAQRILSDGLKAMARHHVHLSLDRETALRVGGRKSKRPVILVVQAGKAHAQKVVFYEANESVWLADYIPPMFISALTDGRQRGAPEKTALRAD